jgi:hypothetical protein
VGDTLGRQISRSLGTLGLDGQSAPSPCAALASGTPNPQCLTCQCVFLSWTRAVVLGEDVVERVSLTAAFKRELAELEVAIVALAAMRRHPHSARIRECGEGLRARLTPPGKLHPASLSTPQHAVQPAYSP